MSHLPTLLWHELRVLFVSASTYIAAILALVMMGFFYFFTIIQLVAADQESPPGELFFSTFWVPVLLVVPMLTMKSIAEERRLGTLQTLLTTSVSAGEVVLSKFFAAYIFYILVWLAALAFPLIAAQVLSQDGIRSLLLDPGPLLGGYAFVFLTGALFIAVGIFSSSLTRSQLVAGMLTFSITFLLIIGVMALQLLNLSGEAEVLAAPALSYLQIFNHFEDFIRGVVDTRPVIYYLSGTALVLGLAVLSVEARI